MKRKLPAAAVLAAAVTAALLGCTGGPAKTATPAKASVTRLTGFDASGVMFPTEGCWQVTGRVGPVTLTFVIKGIR